MVASPAKADFWTGLLLGSMTSSSSKTYVVNQDEFSKQVEVINQQLPQVSRPYPQEIKTFLVTKDDKDKYLNYYTNGGYKVEYKSNQLVFDLSSNYQLFLAQAQEYEKSQAEFQATMVAIKPYLKGIGIFAFSVLLMVSFFRAIYTMNQLGINQWFLKILTKQLNKIKENK